MSPTPRKLSGRERMLLVRKQKEAKEAANWEDIASEVPDAPELAEEFRGLKDDIKVMEERCAEIAPQIEAAVMIGGKSALICGEFRITQVEHPGNAKFLPERLVEKLASFNLTADQILDAMTCCVEKKPYTYPLVARITEAAS